MDGTIAQLPIGRRVSLPGHFDLPVNLESVRPLGRGFECPVRLHGGTLEEAVSATKQENFDGLPFYQARICQNINSTA
jgi:hypothetical protein